MVIVTPKKIGNPGLSQYPLSTDADRLARSVWDMYAFAGDIYVSTGDYWSNRGPVKIWSFNKDGEITEEYTTTDKQIVQFQEYGGELFIAGLDTTSGSGSVYRKDDDGWHKYQTLSGATHVADFAIADGVWYATIGISGAQQVKKSTNSGTSWSTIMTGTLVRYREMFVSGTDLYVMGTEDGTWNFKTFKWDGATETTLSDTPFPQNRGILHSRIVAFGDGFVYIDYRDPRYPSIISNLIWLSSAEVAPVTVSKFNSVSVRDVMVYDGRCYVLSSTATGYTGYIHSSSDMSAWILERQFEVDSPPYSMEILSGNIYVGLGIDSTGGNDEAGSIYLVSLSEFAMVGDDELSVLPYNPDSYSRTPSRSGTRHNLLDGDRTETLQAVHYGLNARYRSMSAESYEMIRRLFFKNELVTFDDGDVPDDVVTKNIYPNATYDFDGIVNASSTHIANTDNGSALPAAEGDYETTEYSTAEYLSVEEEDCYAHLDGSTMFAYRNYTDFPESRMSGDFSITAWIKPDVVSGVLTIAARYRYDDDKREYLLAAVNTEIGFWISDDGAIGTYKATTGFGLTAKEWVFVAVTFDVSAGTADVYKNGVFHEQLTGFPTSIHQSDCGFQIGATRHGAAAVTYYMDGGIDNVCLFDDMRTVEEIKTSALSRDTVEEDPNLIAQWLLDDVSTATALDNGQGDAGRDLKPYNGSDTTFANIGHSHYAATTNPTAGNYLYHKYLFESGIVQADVQRIRVRVIAMGKDASDRNVDGFVLYIWNQSSWMEIGTVSNPEATTFGWFTFDNTEAQNCVDVSDHYVRLLLRSKGVRIGTDDLELRTYFAEVEINPGLSEIVKLNSTPILTGGDVVSVENLTSPATLVLATDYTISDDEVTIIGEDAGDEIEVTYKREFETVFDQLSEQWLDGDVGSDRHRAVSIALETLSESEKGS